MSLVDAKSISECTKGKIMPLSKIVDGFIFEYWVSYDPKRNYVKCDPDDSDPRFLYLNVDAISSDGWVVTCVFPFLEDGMLDSFARWSAVRAVHGNRVIRSLGQEREVSAALIKSGLFRELGRDALAAHLAEVSARRVQAHPLQIDPVTGLYAVRINPNDLDDITRAFGFDWMHDYDYRTSRIFSIQELVEQADGVDEDDPALQGLAEAVLVDVRRQVTDAAAKVMFVPDDTVRARGWPVGGH